MMMWKLWGINMSLKTNQNYRKTPKGVLTNLYHKMKGRHGVSFSLKWLHDTYLEDKKYVRLFNEWVNSGYMKEKKPSIDRISNKKPYTKSNIHIVTWGENRFKQTMERRSRKGVVIQIKEGAVINRFKSQREAVKVTGLNQGLISAVLNNKRTHTGGFQFVYESPELLEP